MNEKIITNENSFFISKDRPPRVRLTGYFILTTCKIWVLERWANFRVMRIMIFVNEFMGKIASIVIARIE